MHDLQVLRDGGYRGEGLRKFKLNNALSSFPDEILELGDTLEELDLSSTGLSSLPANFGAELPHLKVAHFNNCKFEVFPKELASCPNLRAVYLRANGMVGIPEDALPHSLLSLILTNNNLTSLPTSIGQCTNLEKLHIAGNQLTSLPTSLSNCTNLTHLRLNSNRLASLPDWLLTLPNLSALSFARNPCASPVANGTSKTPFGLANIPWRDLELRDLPPRDPSHPVIPGLWKQSEHYTEDVAIQLFQGGPNDSGSPADELAARLAAGAHESLITVLGQIYDHPDENGNSSGEPYYGGTVTQLVPECYTPLGRARSEQEASSAEREEIGAETPSITAACAISMLTGLAGALSHLHSHGIAHGDISSRNVLASKEDEHALLGGFHAATIYGRGHAQEEHIERVEVLAFGYLIDDMLELLANLEDETRGVQGLEDLRQKCAVAEVEDRLTFDEVVEELEGMMGWRGMMRIPTVPGPS
ncbi:hypothetical protein B0T14DRAFT_538507 [Immersiella caudata]|uniref:Protein kinase domain-containing protein n=1 Tax=Immersiella caudata TaxID=314043 RepID=A0AA39WJT9_9PEZI|nr:hypothetical protein B0T14DRAFT_538507 [Immersiella caudata]